MNSIFGIKLVTKAKDREREGIETFTVCGGIFGGESKLCALLRIEMAKTCLHTLQGKYAFVPTCTVIFVIRVSSK